MISCVFCKIVQGTLPSQKVYEDDHVVAFAPLEKDILAKGHLLVVSRTHFSDIYDIPVKQLCFIMNTIKEIATRLRKKFKATGINILHASGRDAQQSVFHFHMHVIPRYEKDTLNTWPKTGYKERDFLEVYTKMKKALQ